MRQEAIENVNRQTHGVGTEAEADYEQEPESHNDEELVRRRGKPIQSHPHHEEHHQPEDVRHQDHHPQDHHKHEHNEPHQHQQEQISWNDHHEQEDPESSSTSEDDEVENHADQEYIKTERSDEAPKVRIKDESDTKSSGRGRGASTRADPKTSKSRGGNQKRITVETEGDEHPQRVRGDGSQNHEDLVPRNNQTQKSRQFRRPKTQGSNQGVDGVRADGSKSVDGNRKSKRKHMEDYQVRVVPVPKRGSLPAKG